LAAGEGEVSFDAATLRGQHFEGQHLAYETLFEAGNMITDRSRRIRAIGPIHLKSVAVSPGGTFNQMIATTLIMFLVVIPCLAFR
jgi:hypothetical protein